MCLYHTFTVDCKLRLLDLLIDVCIEIYVRSLHRQVVSKLEPPGTALRLSDSTLERNPHSACLYIGLSNHILLQRLSK